MVIFFSLRCLPLPGRLSADTSSDTGSDIISDTSTDTNSLLRPRFVQLFSENSSVNLLL